MRRKRPRLEPNTFPFVAVLLCAMGGLILFLLVLDRRARVVARAKSHQVIEQRLRAVEEKRTKQRADYEAELARQLAEQKADWEHRGQELHRSLLGQESQLRTQMAATQKQQETTAARAAAEQARQRQLSQLIAAAEAQLRQLRGDLVERQQVTAADASRMEQGQNELARLHGELAQLERTLRELKSLRAQQDGVFSLIPYAGRRGENRKPLYVECSREGVVFHPDRTVLSGGDLSPRTVRKELDRRLAQWGEVEGLKERLYVLVMIRPEGADLYYLMQAALTGLPIDYGRVLLDSDWVLDLGPNDGSALPPAWGAVDVARPLTPGGNEPQVKGTPVPGSASTLSEGVAVPGPPPPAGGLGSPLVGGVPEPPQGSGGVLTPPQGNAASEPPASGDVLGTNPLLAGPASAPPHSTSGNRQSPAGTAAVEPAPASGGLRPSLVGEVRPPFAGSANPPTGVGQSPATAASTPPNQGADTVSSPNLMPGEPPLAPTPWRSPSQATQQPGTSTSVEPPQATGSPAGPTTGSPNAGGLGPLQSDSVRQTAVILSKLTGNRDWTIVLECRDRSVVLPSQGQEFPLHSLAGEGGPLVQAVRQLIAQKQTTVRPGEPPYRPVLRFDVLAGGLRSYYQATRCLESLRLDMRRGDEVSRELP